MHSRRRKNQPEQSGQSRVAAITALALLTFANNSSAHDFWIEPVDFTPAAGESVPVTLREGVLFRGDTLPYIEQWFREFSLTGPDGTQAVMSITGNDPAADIAFDEGQFMLGYLSIRNFVELKAAKFNSYLEDEGIEFLREERIRRGEDDDPAPEYFIRCAKALIQTAPTDAPVYDTVLGYTLELVPLADPYSLQPGDELTFRLLFRGEPIEGLLVQAFSRTATEDVQKVRTDADGLATVRITDADVWMVKAVQIQPIIGDPKALWQSYWASFLFELPAP